MALALSPDPYSLTPKHAQRASCPLASLVPPLSHPCRGKGETRVVNGQALTRQLLYASTSNSEQSERPTGA